MNIFVVADGHYYEDKYGNVYADSVYDYQFFNRYIRCFGDISVLCRISKDANIQFEKLKKCNGPNITFLKIDDFCGPYQYVVNRASIKKNITNLIKDYDVGIFRIPAALSNIALSIFKKENKKFAVEVVVDPWKFFSPGTTRSIFRPFFRLYWTYLTKKNCRMANAVSYVTESYLQKHYPHSKNAIVASYSSVEISDSSVAEPREYVKKDMVTISHVCNGFNTYGKGHIQLIRALSILRKRGIRVKVVFVGDGPLRKAFESFAKRKGVYDSVSFVGAVSNGEEVRKIIRNSDVFVLPTKAEGLPRALLEAMAEGLPCLSTNVCGIPEVLDESYLFKYRSASMLAKKIQWLINDPINMNSASKNNILTAKRFVSSSLNEKRTCFYNSIKNDLM